MNALDKRVIELIEDIRIIVGDDKGYELYLKDRWVATFAEFADAYRYKVELIMDFVNNQKERQ